MLFGPFTNKKAAQYDLQLLHASRGIVHPKIPERLFINVGDCTVFTISTGSSSYLTHSGKNEFAIIAPTKHVFKSLRITTPLANED